MKRFVALMLVLCLLLPGCGSKTEPLTLDQFLDKYKRADWEQWLADPSEFLTDYNTMKSQKQWAPDLSTFSTEKYDGGVEYEKDIVLFNRPFTLWIDVQESGSLSRLEYNGEAEECRNAFEKLFEKLLVMEGDPHSFKYDREEIDEASFRKALSSKDLGKSMSVVWYERESKSGYATLVSYSNISEPKLTIY